MFDVFRSQLGRSFIAVGPARVVTFGLVRPAAAAPVRLFARATRKKAETEEEVVEKPKRPPNAYVLFTKNQFPKFQRRIDPNVEGGFLPNIARHIGEKWNQLKPAQKQVWESKAAQLKQTWLETQPKRIPRPPSAYALFSREERGVIQSENADTIPFGDMAKELASRWKHLSAEKRDQFTAKANTHREEHLKNYPPPEKPAKRPPNAYLLFSQAHRAEITKANPTWKVTQVATELGKRWSALSETEKRPWETQAEELRRTFNVAHPKPPREKKRPSSAYQLFVKARYSTLPKPKKGTLKLAKASKSLGKLWKDLPKEEKAQFESRAATEKQAFDVAHPKPPPGPKRPLNAYLLWAAEERPKLTRGTEKHKVTEQARKLGARWADVDEHTKSEFHIRANKAMDIWKRDHPPKSKTSKAAATA